MTTTKHGYEGWTGGVDPVWQARAERDRAEASAARIETELSAAYRAFNGHHAIAVVALDASPDEREEHRDHMRAIADSARRRWGGDIDVERLRFEAALEIGLEELDPIR
ncbi:MAG TPA: hypothetical protein ENK57_20445 [Polyangiaceae bacterium]|nr:hypothetical protein [Polyangiaceae bacterium]